MSSYQWALLVHLVGAFLYLGGNALGNHGVCERGAEPIRPLLDLSNVGETTSAVGAVVLFGFASWLIDLMPCGFGDAWIIASGSREGEA